MNEAREFERSEVRLLPINSIKTDPDKPRRFFSSKDLKELSDSIRRFGVVQPVSVKRLPNGRYELISGERRLRASVYAGKRNIPAIIYSFYDDDMDFAAIIDNIKRCNLNFLEEAESYRLLLEKYGFTQQELSEKVGKDQSTIANKLRLLKLSPEIKRFIRENNMTERHARAVIRFENERDQRIILKRICEENLSGNDAEKLVRDEIIKCEEKRRKRGPNKIYEYLPSGEKDDADNYSVIISNYKKMVFSVRQMVDDLRSEGIYAKAAQFDRGEYMEVIIRVPKKVSESETV